MMLLDPLLYERLQLFGSFDDLVRIGARGNMRPIVIDFVPLATTDLEVASNRFRRRPHRESERVKRDFVMSAGF